METERYLYCPGRNCGNKLCKIGQGKFKRDIEIKCRKCRRLVKYNCKTEEVVFDVVPRADKAGSRRFY